MSLYYYVYTEGFVGGRWTCLNSFLPVDGGYEMVKTYQNLSRMFFEATYQKLDELGCEIGFSELSLPLQEEARDNVWYKALAVDLDAMRRIMPRMQKMEYHGYVEKSQLFALESEQASEIEEWITVKEYSALDDEAKKSYQYHEWNNEFGWYQYFLLIMERVEWQIRDWRDVHSQHEPESVRIIITVL